MNQNKWAPFLGAAFLMLTGLAAASVSLEDADAGTTIDTAGLLSVGTTSIQGVIEYEGDTDLYAFTLAQAGMVQFRMGDSYFDDNLLLFNAEGHGLGASDDQGGGLDSRISIHLEAGLYYIGAGANNMAAFDGAGEIFDNDWGDSNGVLVSPVRAMTYIGPEFGVINRQNVWNSPYTVTLDYVQAPVPEPGSMVLMVCGMVLGTALQQRRRGRRWQG